MFYCTNKHTISLCTNKLPQHGQTNTEPKQNIYKVQKNAYKHPTMCCATIVNKMPCFKAATKTSTVYVV